MWALHDTDGIVNYTILFVRSRWLKQCTTWLFGHVMPVLVSHDTDGIINSTITFVNSRWPKWDATWHLWSWNAIGTIINIMWCQWNHQLHCYFCLMKIIEMQWNMTILVMWCIWCWHWHHVMFMVLSMAQLHFIAEVD